MVRCEYGEEVVLSGLYLRDVVCDSVATGPLGNGLHNCAEEKSIAICGNCRDIFDDTPKRGALKQLLFCPAIAEDVVVFMVDGTVCIHRGFA